MSCTGFLPALISLCALAALHRSSGAEVRISGRQLLVDGEPIHLKGVNWNPVRRGGTEPQNVDFRGFVQADAQMMAAAGINAVRTYQTITDMDVLDALWAHKIYVLPTVYSSTRQGPVTTIRTRVEAVKDHPSILMWLVGNEWNYNGLYSGLDVNNSTLIVKEAVDFIKEVDGTHPVATVYGGFPSNYTFQLLSNVDVWAFNKYHLKTFDGILTRWEHLAPGPMFIAEYGADAFDARKDQMIENQDAQTEATVALTNIIIEHSSMRGGVCLGGFLFEFADELWKDAKGDVHLQDTGGMAPGGGPFPDSTFNEEWWGLVDVDGRPRKAYYDYAKLRAPGALPSNLEEVPQSTPLRASACGSHWACEGNFGFCCPDELSGLYKECCYAVEPTAAPVIEAPSGGGGFAFHHAYRRRLGDFADRRFSPKVAANSCQGEAECQFQEHLDALEFCERHEECTAVLLHPQPNSCLAGFGCYTPRAGVVARNSSWHASGGVSWVKSSLPDSGELPALQIFHT